MIIKSEARRLGGLTAHLTDTKKNECVVHRHDLDRDANRDLGTALLDFGTNAKLSNPNPRARQLFHIKVSPSHILTESELNRTIEIIEAEHNIPPSTPRKVVEHQKGNRAKHFHLVYSHYDPISGKAICTKRNHVNDEMASRLCELAFSEPIIIGKHTEENIKELEARNLPEGAAKLRRTMNAKEQPSSDRSIIQYNDADTLKKSVSFEKRVWELFMDSNRDINSFKSAATKASFIFAMGDKALMIVNPETRISLPLLRLLNKKAKAKGIGSVLRKADLDELIKEKPLPPLKAAREQSTTRKINHIKHRAMIERELFLRFSPRTSVEQPVDPVMGKKGNPTIQTIEAAMEFNRQLQETLRHKLLAILLKKKIIRRLTKRLERKSPRGMVLFLANERGSKMNGNTAAMMVTRQIANKPKGKTEADRIAATENSRAVMIQDVPQRPVVPPTRSKIKNTTPKKQSKRVTTGIER